MDFGCRLDLRRASECFSHVVYPNYEDADIEALSIDAGEDRVSFEHEIGDETCTLTGSGYEAFSQSEGPAHHVVN
jgi:hypothetical protein